jgi:hypothetical protein
MISDDELVEQLSFYQCVIVQLSNCTSHDSFGMEFSMEKRSFYVLVGSCGVGGGFSLCDGLFRLFFRNVVGGVL